MATVPKPITTSDEQLVRTLATEWEHHYNARNIDKLLVLYAGDGLIMAPFYPMARGLSEMRQFFVEVLQENEPRNLTIETIHVEVTGNIAFGIGTFKDNVKLPSGKRMDVPGKWTTVVHRIGGNWKIFAHCWNPDLPVSKLTT